MCSLGVRQGANGVMTDGGTVVDEVYGAAFLDSFQVVDDDDVEADYAVSGPSSQPLPRQDGAQALATLAERPVCEECGQEDSVEGGGRYGVDDHEGLFYCGRCWVIWDGPEKAEIMKPLYLQRRVRDRPQPEIRSEPEEDNFFKNFEGGGVDCDGSDDAVGAWSAEASLRDGEQALPGSWHRPLCVECGNDEGDEGGGRYGHDDDVDKFYCGRCWQSWDVAARRRMMMAYAPQERHFANDLVLDLFVDCPPPDLPMWDDDLDYFEDDFASEEEAAGQGASSSGAGLENAAAPQAGSAEEGEPC